MMAFAALCLPQAAYAQTSCTAANQFRYDFTTAAAQTLNYATTYNWNATNTLAQTQAFSLSFQTFNLTSSVVAGVQMPAVTNIVNDGAPATGNNLVIGGIFAGRTATITANTRVIATTFTFATPVREFTVQANDVDFASNQYRDWMHIQGANGANTYTGVISTPFGTNNGTGAKTNAGSTIQLGASTTPLTVGVNEGIGNATAPNTDNSGTMTAVFAQPVTSVTLRYGNSNQSTGGGTTGQQAYGIQWIRFCPMPAIAIAKTSAPVATGGTDPNRFNIPGADVDYTITVSNTGGSTIDINTALIADVLPSNVTFFNGDIDTVTAGTQNFVFTPGTSGLTLAAGNIAYSNNGGSTYAYAPAAGYDAAVDAVRFLPQGTMAANSSFTIRFRTRIN